MGFLWSVYQKYVAKIEQPNFKWYYTIFYAQFTSYLQGKGFIATTQKIDKILPIRLEVGQIWTTGAS
jgi:hypothetical protein